MKPTVAHEVGFELAGATNLGLGLGPAEATVLVLRMGIASCRGRVMVGSCQDLQERVRVRTSRS